MKYLNKSAVVYDFFCGKKYVGFAKVIKSHKHKKCCKIRFAIEHETSFDGIFDQLRSFDTEQFKITRFVPPQKRSEADF